jgi:hypothetical protein
MSEKSPKTYPAFSEIISAMIDVNNTIERDHKCYHSIGDRLVDMYGWKKSTAGVDKLRDPHGAVYMKEIPMSDEDFDEFPQYRNIRVILNEEGVRLIVFYEELSNTRRKYTKSLTHRITQDTNPSILRGIKTDTPEKSKDVGYSIEEVVDAVGVSLKCKQEKLCRMGSIKVSDNFTLSSS